MDNNHNALFWKKHRQIRTLPPDEKARIAGRLVDFLERIHDASSAGWIDPRTVIGFYERTKPSLMGVVIADRRRMNELCCVNLYSCENADPEFHLPFLKVGLPAWINGFTVAAFLENPTETDSLKKMKAIENRLIAVSTAAAVRLWTLERAFFNSDRDIAVATYRAPLLYKRAILAMFPFVEADISCEDLHSNKVIFLPAAASSSDCKILFFTRKVELTMEATKKNIRILHENNIKVIVVMYHWREISEVLQEVVSFDGCVVLPLSSTTDVVRIVACQLKKTKGIRMTRAQEDQLLMDELSWTFPFLFAEGHMERSDFEQWLADKLECVLCCNKEKHNAEEHKKMIYHQVRFHSLQLRQEEYRCNNEFSWYDSASMTVKNMQAEMKPDPDAFLFENSSPGTPAINFLGWSVPSTEPDWVPHLNLSQ